MTATWIPDGNRVQPGRDGDGDETTGAYSVRFLLEEGPRLHTYIDDCRHVHFGKGTEKLHSLLTVDFYGRFYGNEEDGFWGIAMRTELMVCADPDDPHTSVRWYDYDDEDLDRYDYDSAERADAKAKQLAEGYTAYLANRDINWDGRAVWETSPWPR